MHALCPWRPSDPPKLLIDGCELPQERTLSPMRGKNSNVESHLASAIYLLTKHFQQFLLSLVFELCKCLASTFMIYYNSIMCFSLLFHLPGMVNQVLSNEIHVPKKSICFKQNVTGGWGRMMSNVI